MTKKVFILAVFMFAAAFVAAQDFSGDWQGPLAVGQGQMRLVLHVTKNSDGTLKAVLDSPDQAITGIPVDSITANANKLHFTISLIKSAYDGTLKGNGNINGTWVQGEHKGPLVLAKTTTPVKLQHDPAPPSNIDGTWEGQLDTGGGTIHLVFHLKNTADGLTATMDSPDQKMKGWPATAITRKGSSIKITMAQVGGSFSGSLNKTLDSMSGDWSQGEDVPLILKKAKNEPAEAAKPDAEKK
jgi:hypothetical protein